MATVTRGKRKHCDSAYRALRKEKSRVCAERRRKLQKTVMDELTSLLPFPADVTSTLDNSSLLRLILCYFKLKSLVGQTSTEQQQQEAGLETPESGNSCCNSPSSENGTTSMSPVPVHRYGVMQDLFMEALDGMVVVFLVDGTIMYISESMLKHLGLFQSEHIGTSIYNLLHADDQTSFSEKISKAERDAEKSPNGSAKVTFFSRIRCSRFKVTNTNTLSPGYKLVYLSGTLKIRGSEPYIVCLVQPVNPPSILEVRSEGNVFTMHFTMEMKCTFYDGRLWHLLGYKKNDFIGTTPFVRHHHDDVESTLQCGKEVMEKGEALSSYYRMLTKFGHYIWIQTRATVMKCGRSGSPSYIICMNYVISKEDGERFLAHRMTVGNTTKSVAPISHDPFPVANCKDEKLINPLRDEQEPIPRSLSSASSIATESFPPSTASTNLDATSPRLDTTSPRLDTTGSPLDTNTPRLDTTASPLNSTASSLDTMSPFLDTIMPSLDTSPPSADTPPDMSFLESILQPPSVGSSECASLSPASSFLTMPSPNSVASFGVQSHDSMLPFTPEMLSPQSNAEDLTATYSCDLSQTNDSYKRASEASASNVRPNSSSSDEGCLLDSSSNASTPNIFSVGSATCNSVVSELDQGYQSDFVPSVSSATPQSYINTSSPYHPPPAPPPNSSPATYASTTSYSSSTWASQHTELSASLPLWESELGHVNVSYSQGMKYSVPSSTNCDQRCLPSVSFAVQYFERLSH